MPTAAAPLPPPAAPPPLRAGAPLPSWSQLRAIADGQRLIIWALLAGFVLIPGGAVFGAAAGGSAGLYAWIVFMVAVRLFMAVAVYRLAAALGSRVAILWAIGGFLPNLIGLVVILVLSARATKRLRAVGLKVGFLGTKLPEEPPPGVLTAEVSQIFS